VPLSQGGGQLILHLTSFDGEQKPSQIDLDLAVLTLGPRDQGVIGGITLARDARGQINVFWTESSPAGVVDMQAVLNASGEIVSKHALPSISGWMGWGATIPFGDGGTIRPYIAGGPASGGGSQTSLHVKSFDSEQQASGIDISLTTLNLAMLEFGGISNISSSTDAHGLIHFFWTETSSGGVLARQAILSADGVLLAKNTIPVQGNFVTLGPAAPLADGGTVHTYVKSEPGKLILQLKSFDSKQQPSGIDVIVAMPTTAPGDQHNISAISLSMEVHNQINVFWTESSVQGIVDKQAVISTEGEMLAQYSYPLVSPTSGRGPIIVLASSLFTEMADVVDFANLTDAQYQAIVSGADYNHALGGNDKVKLSSVYHLVDGGSGNDVLNGSPINDEIAGGPDDDELTGHAGNDTFIVSAGIDTITDLGESDILVVDVGATAIVRVAGNYTATPQSNNSGTTVITTDGWSVDLSAVASSMNGYSITNTGNEASLKGSNGDDVIEGGHRDDLLDGGSGRDTLSGQGGSDTFEGIKPFSDAKDVNRVFGGDDLDAVDTLRYSGSYSSYSIKSVSLNDFSGQVGTVTGAQDSFSGIEVLEFFPEKRISLADVLEGGLLKLAILAFAKAYQEMQDHVRQLELVRNSDGSAKFGNVLAWFDFAGDILQIGLVDPLLAPDAYEASKKVFVSITAKFADVVVDQASTRLKHLAESLPDAMREEAYARIDEGAGIVRQASREISGVLYDQVQLGLGLVTDALADIYVQSFSRIGDKLEQVYDDVFSKDLTLRDLPLVDSIDPSLATPPPTQPAPGQPVPAPIYIKPNDIDPLTYDGSNMRGAESNVVLSILGHAIDGVVVVSGSGNDSIRGSSFNDYISTSGGDDLVVAGAGDDVLLAGAGHNVISGGDGGDTFDVALGANTVSDVITNLRGDKIIGFGLDDALELQAASLDRDMIDVNRAENITTIGVGGIGFELIGDFMAGDFMSIARGTGPAAHSIVTFESFLPLLFEGASVNPDLVNGIANEPFLVGDGNVGFSVELMSAASAFANTLGSYIVATDGTIHGVRVLFGDTLNVQEGARSVKLDPSENGEKVGFFLIQNGGGVYGNLPSDLTFVAAANAMPVDVNGGVPPLLHSATLGDLNRTPIFHSIATLNPADANQVLSGVALGGEGLLIGFEDLQRAAGDNDYQDVVIEVRAIRDDYLLA
jgi:Ca2+-binding RTX toxin-like protein